MRVLICPDKFAGTLSATAVAEAVAEGWNGDATLIRRPLSDGGPGFVEVLADSLLGHNQHGDKRVGHNQHGDKRVGHDQHGDERAGRDQHGDERAGRLLPVPTVDPLGRPAGGEILLAGGVAYVESAQACGLHLLTAEERDPNTTSSYGLGLLITAAVEAGAAEVVVGLGGSATNDGGAGMLAALGAPPVDAAGYALPYGGAYLNAAAGLAGEPRLRDVRLVAATDVDSPMTGLHGASNVFGPQKGASREDVYRLDAALEVFAGVLERSFGVTDLQNRPGGGAAGGIGAALIALGGRVTSGIGLVTGLIGLERELDAADLVITGEGSFDHQSLRGKVVAGVANGARDRGIPCVVLCGRNETGNREAAAAGVTETRSLTDHFGSEAEAMARPAEGLRELAHRLSSQWDRP